MHTIPKGGHALGDPREAFHVFVENGVDADAITIGGETRSRAWLFAVLSRCSDLMPRDYCDDLGLPQGSTYAQAVQHLS